MKKIYGLFVLFILIGITSCSSDEYSKPPIVLQTQGNLWPLATYNYWLMAKDTINDTIKIDTSYTKNNIDYFVTNQFKSVYLANDSKNINTELFIVDSIYYMQFPEISIVDMGELYSQSAYNVPLVNPTLQLEVPFSTNTSFTQFVGADAKEFSVNSESQIIEKNVLEAVAGQVFTQVTKVKNTYTFISDSKTQTYNREIWFQLNVGPIKIVDLDNNITYLLTSYQLSNNL